MVNTRTEKVNPMLRAIVDKYLTPIKIVGCILVVITILGGGIYIKMLQADNRALSKDLTLKQIEVDGLQGTVDLLKFQRDKDQKASLLIAQSYTDLRTENQRISDELATYKGRTSTVIKKPTLVERRINRAVDRLFKSFNCDTGGECSTAISPASTRPSEP